MNRVFEKNFEKYYQKLFIKNLFKLFLLIIFMLGLIYILLPKLKSVQKTFSPKIGVTIYPFYDLTKEVVGDKFEVILIIPPGAEPHNFEPTPVTIKNIQGIKIIFASGLNIDQWAVNVQNVIGDVKIVNFSHKVNFIKINNEIDPHFWLSLENAKKIAEIVKEEMINFDPNNKDYYQENYQKVIAKINELQKLAEDTKKEIKSPYLIVQHNAFNYLAKDLNLEIAGSLEGPNKELTIKELKNLVDKIRLMKIKVVFKEAGEESNLLENLAKQFNLKIYELDSIEGKSGLDYFSAYQKNLETLKSALK